MTGLMTLCALQACTCEPAAKPEDASDLSLDAGLDAGLDLRPDDGQPSQDMPSDQRPDHATQTQRLAQDHPAAMMAVAGDPGGQVWVVGARHAGQPTLARWDGRRWERVALDEPEVDLWWVHVQGPEVFVSGSDGAILRGGAGRPFERMQTPGLARHTVFGLWGDGSGQLYAVGGVGARSGFIWRYDGQRWRSLPLPADMPKLPNGATAGLFKVWGDARGVIWFVGNAGAILRLDPGQPLRVVPSPTRSPLLTVAGDQRRVWAVGGASHGQIVDLSVDPPTLLEPEDTPLLQGLHVRGDEAVAVGARGVALRYDGQAWRPLALAAAQQGSAIESLHAAWIDAQGQLWAAGGGVLSTALDRGALLGPPQIPALSAPPAPPDPPPPSCPPEVLARGEHRSVARRWMEQNLEAIRQDLPQPGVHARNLYHLSLAIFDAWASAHEDQQGLVAQESLSARDEAAVTAAISHAAYRVLSHRYSASLALGAPRTSACLRALMQQLGLDPDDDRTVGADAVAVGNRIGLGVLERFAQDGALEQLAYQDATYQAPNPALEVDEPGVDVEDPTLWQPLDISVAVSQNGIPLGSGPQGYIGPHWGQVTPFALQRSAPGAPYVQTSPGEALRLGPALRAHAVEVIRRTAWLDVADEAMMDASPGAYGAAPLGQDLGPGHPLNPVTGQPYQAQRVKRSDFGRVLAEYWADGPHSETPPGHWNVIAHQVVDHPRFQGLATAAQPWDALALDVHLSVTLNGALHDAAIVAWELKRLHQSARPITLIRWMSQQGQSSDPALPSYHPDGLPLEPGLIELITAQSSAPGQRHEHLAAYQGQVAVFTWPGAPQDHRRRSSPCAWVRGVEWSPYQPRTFVSPAFPGYTSGHSTFSRAAAEVLTGLTGSPYFPGGLAEFVAEPGQYLKFEDGPSAQVRLQWATYADAADQAGQSRLWGGIHILPDDLDGRATGAMVGQRALAHARQRLTRLAP